MTRFLLALTVGAASLNAALAQSPLASRLAQLSQDFRADVQRWRACAAVLGPSRHQDALRAQLTALTGREPAAVDGVFLWRDLGGR